MAPRNQTPDILTESGLPLIYKTTGVFETLSARSAPEFVRTHVKSLTVFQKEAFVTSRRADQTWRMASDEGKYLLGHDAAPAPLAFLTVGMIASFMNEILALARLRDIKIANIRVIQDNFYSMKGSMRQGTMVASANDVLIECQIESPAKGQMLQGLVADAIAASPMGGLMRKNTKSLFSLTHNGRGIEPGVEFPIDRGEISAEAQSGSVSPAAGDWNKTLVRKGISPKNQHSQSIAGSSLTDAQDRMLHLRGICTQREDGVKVVEQQLFNPHGTAWTFLSDEGADDGGKGLAPNAASYISAGIGFCFMTQFGRFAKMQDSKLLGYEIVQDMNASLGGASGGTGKPGEVDPIATHVFLTSNEDDDFARNILAVSERTCFLHAFCKAEIKAKIRVKNRLD